jgi:hypothetical protein
MEIRTLGDLSSEEFAQALERLDDPDYGEMSGEDFFATWAVFDAAKSEDVELKMHLEGNRLVFEEPAPLPVEGDALIIGGRRIVIKLRDLPQIA